MRIAAISDLHVDTSPYNALIVPHIVRRLLLDVQPDVLCLLGDISPTVATVRQTLELFAPLACKKLFIPGNHDLWMSPSDVRACARGLSKSSSRTKLSKFERACKETGWQFLMSKPLVLDDVGFAGTIGWYDYSMRDQELEIPDEDYESKTTGTQMWNDVNYVFLGMTDQAATIEFNKYLETGLEKISKCRKKVACSHHVPFREIQRSKDGFAPSFFNAFGGNLAMGKLLVEHRVDVSLSGHLHRNFRINVRGVECYQTAIGYLGEEFLFGGKGENVDWTPILDDRIAIIDL